MTDYTLDVDSMSLTVTLQDVALESDCILNIDALSVAESLADIALEADCILSVDALPIVESLTGITLKLDCVLPVDFLSVLETYTDWRYTYESFYWMTGALALWTSRSNYRMQGTIVNYVTTTPKTRSAFATNYIKPDDVNPDDKFNL